jgi:hypothetical protein
MGEAVSDRRAVLALLWIVSAGALGSGLAGAFGTGPRADLLAFDAALGAVGLAASLVVWALPASGGRRAPSPSSRAFDGIAIPPAPPRAEVRVAPATAPKAPPLVVAPASRALEPLAEPSARNASPPSTESLALRRHSAAAERSVPPRAARAAPRAGSARERPPAPVVEPHPGRGLASRTTPPDPRPKPATPAEPARVLGELETISNALRPTHERVPNSEAPQEPDERDPTDSGRTRRRASHGSRRANDGA